MGSDDSCFAMCQCYRSDPIAYLRDAALREGGLQLRFEGALGRRYQLEGAAQLGAPLEPVGVPVSGDWTTVELLVPVAAGADTLIYRVRVRPD